MNDRIGGVELFALLVIAGLAGYWAASWDIQPVDQPAVASDVPAADSDAMGDDRVEVGNPEGIVDLYRKACNLAEFGVKLAKGIKAAANIISDEDIEEAEEIVEQHKRRRVCEPAMSIPTPLFDKHRKLCDECAAGSPGVPLCPEGFRLLQQDLKNYQNQDGEHLPDPPFVEPDPPAVPDDQAACPDGQCPLVPAAKPKRQASPANYSSGTCRPRVRRFRLFRRWR